MRYDIRVSHITPDYTIIDGATESWNCTLEDSELLVLLLNRIAIATTQFTVVDFPEVQVNAESRHALIRAIGGKLYYSEMNSSHRKDLVVVPEEVVRLLEGQPVGQALRRAPEEGVYTRPSPGGSIGTKRYKSILFVASLVLVALAGAYSWQYMSQQVRLVQSPHFVHTMENEGELLRQYADVYLNELREGATVLELTDDGQLALYELWYAPAKKAYDLVPAGVYRVSAGLHRGKPALLAGEIHLLELKDDGIVFHEIPYERHGKPLKSLGAVQKEGF